VGARAVEVTGGNGQLAGLRGGPSGPAPLVMTWSERPPWLYLSNRVTASAGRFIARMASVPASQVRLVYSSRT
jgi:hypothetical protein